MLLTNLSRDADNTASRTGSSVASLEGLLVVTLAEIVGAGVDNNGAANDAVGANQLDKRVGDGTLGVTLSIGLDVTQVTNVTGLIRRRAVSLVEGVEVRTGRGAAVGVVTKGVDVEATLCVGVVAGDVVGDGGRGTLRGLLEDDGAGDLGVSSEDSDCNAGLARCVVDSTNRAGPSRDTPASQWTRVRAAVSIKVAARPALHRGRLSTKTPSNERRRRHGMTPPLD